MTGSLHESECTSSHPALSVESAQVNEVDKDAIAAKGVGGVNAGGVNATMKKSTMHKRFPEKEAHPKPDVPHNLNPSEIFARKILFYLQV